MVLEEQLQKSDQDKWNELLETISDALHRLFEPADATNFEVSMGTLGIFNMVQQICPGKYSVDVVSRVLVDHNFQLKNFPDYGPEWLLIKKK